MTTIEYTVHTLSSYEWVRVYVEAWIHMNKHLFLEMLLEEASPVEKNNTL